MAAEVKLLRDALYRLKALADGVNINNPVSAGMLIQSVRDFNFLGQVILPDTQEYIKATRRRRKGQ